MSDQTLPAGRTAAHAQAARALRPVDVTRRAMVTRSGFTLAALAAGAVGCAGELEGASLSQPGALAGINPMSPAQVRAAGGVRGRRGVPEQFTTQVLLAFEQEPSPLPALARPENSRSR